MDAFGRVRLTIRPEAAGAKEYASVYGERLVCVRYRYDEVRKRRYKTVEIVVDEQHWRPLPAADAIVGVRVLVDEIDLRSGVKRAGGVWDSAKKVWLLRYEQVVALGLVERLVDEDV